MTLVAFHTHLSPLFQDILGDTKLKATFLLLWVFSPFVVTVLRMYKIFLLCLFWPLRKEEAPEAARLIRFETAIYYNHSLLYYYFLYRVPKEPTDRPAYSK